jgi:type II secretory pathway predicted ATPase ExeA
MAVKPQPAQRRVSVNESYFGLAEAPFSIAPAPRYLYMSQRHQEALAHLLYGVNSGGGFVLLTGEVGAGKTTVCRCLLEQIPETCDVAYIFNPKLTVEELLSSICVEFGIAHPAGNSSIKVFVDCINTHLLDAHARGRHAVLIIDEAQNLSADVLEQMRLLTNLETSERKLLQIILIGQPELATMLERPELKQLSQRIVARYHLGALSKAEVAAYIRHRLEIAGTQKTLFPASLTAVYIKPAAAYRASSTCYAIARCWAPMSRVKIASIEKPCNRPVQAEREQAEAQGLRCRSARGSMVELRRLNHPAVLILRDEGGARFSAALISLQGRQASLVVGSRQIETDVGTLATQWDGEYHLLWQAPPQLEATLRPDDSGPGVIWLRARMDGIDGKVTETAAPDRYDAALAERVRSFQQARDLKPDGRVGAQTLLHLLNDQDESATAASPRLSRSAGVQ